MKWLGIWAYLVAGWHFGKFSWQTYYQNRRTWKRVLFPVSVMYPCKEDARPRLVQGAAEHPHLYRLILAFTWPVPAAWIITIHTAVFLIKYHEYLFEPERFIGLVKQLLARGRTELLRVREERRKKQLQAAKRDKTVTPIHPLGSS